MPSQHRASTVLVNFRLDRHLAARVKEQAAQNGETMLALVTRALRRELNGETFVHADIR